MGNLALSDTMTLSADAYCKMWMKISEKASKWTLELGFLMVDQIHWLRGHLHSPVLEPDWIQVSQSLVYDPVHPPAFWRYIPVHLPVAHTERNAILHSSCCIQ